MIQRKTATCLNFLTLNCPYIKNFSTGFTETEKLQGVIEHRKMLLLLQFSLQSVGRALLHRYRSPTVQTGQVVAIF